MAKRMVRKRFIISGLCLVLTSLFYVMQSNGAFADIAEGRKCKTMINGECTEYFAPVLQSGVPQNYVQNMENINQTQYMEAYQPAPYKYVPKITQKQICSMGYGFNYIYDDQQYSIWTGTAKSKIFITNVETNSPAKANNLRQGDELLKINGEKISKYHSWDEVANVLEHNNTITLDIKNENEKRRVTLYKNNICTIDKNYDEKFNKYWEQICNFNLRNAQREIYYAEGISRLLSGGTKDMLASAHSEISYWSQKQRNFRLSYNNCINNSNSENELNNCLSLQVNNEIQQIAKDKELEQRRQALIQEQAYQQEQVRLQKAQINALNNYSNALQNQHVQVDTNVYHSGSVNVNHSGTVNVNGNYNVNGTFYHY